MMKDNTALDLPHPGGTIYPFPSGDRSTFGILLKEIRDVCGEPQAKTIIRFAGFNLLCTVVLLLWCNTTNSMALTAYTYLTIFDIFSLITCIISIWVKKQKPTPIFSFGYERFEVLAVFASTMLAQLGSFFIIKGSIERMILQPEVHTGRLLLGTSLGFFFHMLVTYSTDNKAFEHVIAASSSSWLQEHVSDISESVCHVVPGLSKLLLPRINPFTLIAFAGALALSVTYIVIDMNNYYSADTWAAVWIALMTCGTMFPMTVYTGKLLLQTNPSHIIGQLDKCIREASTLDGVLEFRHEHFWTLAFGTMAGSVHVRIRRDADEQMVVAHVFNRLSSMVRILTVQVFKDDWSRPSAFKIIGDSSLLSRGSGVVRLPMEPPDRNTQSHLYGAMNNVIATKPLSNPGAVRSGASSDSGVVGGATVSHVVGTSDSQAGHAIGGMSTSTIGYTPGPPLLESHHSEYKTVLLETKTFNDITEKFH